MAPSGQGPSHCLAPFGRQPGRLAAPVAGFRFARSLPGGNPREASWVQSWIDTVQQAVARIGTSPRPAIPSLAGDLAAMTPPCLRRSLRKARLPWVSRQRALPSRRSPTPKDVHPILDGPAGTEHGPHPRCTSPARVDPPTRGRKPHGQPAVPWSRAPHLQRSSRRERARGDGRHGPHHDDVGPHPPRSPLEASAHASPRAAPEMPLCQSIQRPIKLDLMVHSFLG